MRVVIEIVAEATWRTSMASSWPITSCGNNKVQCGLSALLLTSCGFWMREFGRDDEWHAAIGVEEIDALSEKRVTID
jgi:hypothetical protein